MYLSSYSLTNSRLQRTRVGVVEVQRVVAEDHAFRRELLLQQRVLEAGGREHELGLAVHQARAVRGAHEDRQVGEQQRREDEIGLGRLQRRDVRRQVERADLRPLLGDDLELDAELLQQRLEGGDVVAAVRIVGVDAGDRLKTVPFQYLIASSDPITASHSLSVLRKT